MKNKLIIKMLPDNCVQTDIIFAGVSMMEIHLKDLHDSKVLTKILERKYYQNIPGEWEISFPDDGWETTATTFEKLIEAAHMHIFNRDNSIMDYDADI